MIADCPGCAPAAADAGRRGGSRGRITWLALFPAVLSALAPKCPLCLVAYLSAFGVTFGVASFALTVLRPLAVVSAALGLALALRRVTAR